MNGPKTVYSELFVATVEEIAQDIIPGWDVELMDQPQDPSDYEEANAVTSQLNHMHTTQVWFAQDVVDGDRKLQTRIIVHELLHALFRDSRLQVHALIDRLPSYDERMREQDIWRHHEELIVDRLVRVIRP